MPKYERVDENNVKVTRELTKVVSIQDILKARRQIEVRILKTREQAETDVVGYEEQLKEIDKFLEEAKSMGCDIELREEEKKDEEAQQ